MATGDVSALNFSQQNDADDGDFTTPVVAAVTGKKIQVMGLVATVLTTAGVFSLKSGSTVIFAHHLALGAPLVVGFNGLPICETAAGEALNANNGTGVDSYCTVAYREVEA